jgi:hypothetical protein
MSDYKKIYNKVMKELKQFNLYNKDGNVISFQQDALLTTLI